MRSIAKARRLLDIVKATEAGGTFKVSGSVEDRSALSGRIELAYFTLAEKHETLAYLEHHGIFSVGRYGAWEYSAMEDALWHGRQAAERART